MLSGYDLSTLEDGVDYKVNQVVNSYKAQGYSLTLRQVYYQFVARDWLPERWADPKTGSVNNQRSYKNLGELINTGRIAGLIDWTAIEDRTRELTHNPHWTTPGTIIESAAYSYGIDKWSDQPVRIEVWVEKDALEGVVAKPCRENDVAFFSCRGYASQTALWDAGQRLSEYVDEDQDVIILHLGDHDPSGKDMTRDIEDRLRLFMGDNADRLEVKRIALNMDQIRLYNPPPNPAKITDSRAAGYIDEYGEESWELDALEPSVINNLIVKHIEEARDEDLWKDAVIKERSDKDLLNDAAARWGEVASFLQE
ncbi:hypothetical protein GCM10028806_33290 [Spirosoma terrae]|uniref:hypothetical protein n=1 Tax=Spirosoma terrae TaxID=1968276 RepID=UPI001BB02727|nr:hypothetical protein [Spirosoma terrae]